MTTAKKHDRSFLIMIVAALVAIAAGYSAFWFYARDQFMAAVEAAAAERRAAGDTLRWTSVAYGGYPFRLQARFTGFEAVSHGVTVSAPELRVYALPWKAGHVIAEVPSLSGAAGEALFTAAASRASLLLSGGKPVRADADLGLVTLKDRAGAMIAEAARVQLHGRLGSGQGGGATEDYDLAASLAGAVFAKALPVAGTRLTEARAVVRLKASPPFARGFSVPDAEMFWTALAQNKTRAELPEITLAWGDIRASGKGELTIDGALRPQGRIDWTVQGVGPLFEALRAEGILPGLETPAAEAALSALPTGPDGAAITLLLKDGKATLGPFDAGMIPALAP